MIITLPSTATLSTTSSTASTASTSSTSSARHGHGRGTPGFVQTAATALGMTSSDVLSALQSGQSLADLATSQGVSRDDLAAALEAGAPADLKHSSDADQKISALIDQKGLSPAGGPPAGASADASAATGDASASDGTTTSGTASTGRHHHVRTSGVLSGSSTLTSGQQSTLDTLSGLLGTSSNSLLQQLQSGTSLVDLLGQAGVSMDSLSSKLEEGLLVDTTA